MKKFLRIFGTSLLVSALTVTTVWAAPTSQELEDKKNALEGQRDAAQSQVSSLQGELSSVLEEIDKLEVALIAKGEEIQQATEDLETAQKQEEEQYEAMKLRIKFMYEQGGSSFIETLCTATDFTDLINKAEYVEGVSTYDRNMLNEYVAIKEEVISLKAELEADAAEMETMQAEYETQKESLNGEISTKQAQISDFDSQIQAAAEAAAAARAEEAAAAAAAAAAAEAEQGNAGSGSSNSGSNSGSGSGNTGSGNTGSGNSNSGNSTGGGTGDSSKAQTIVNAAYSQLGVKYVWGGTTPGVGLDCSGLTQYAHRQAGISIPRTSGPQGGGGKAVSSPQAGDIVCYAGHVGIYIGGGQMIHAPHTGAVVRVQAVYGSPWYRRYW